MINPAKTSRLKKKIFVIIFRSDTRLGRLFDLVLLWMILLSIFTVFLESVNEISERHNELIKTSEWIFTIFFTAEYLLRVYSSHRPFKYIFSFYGFIDLIAFLPTYLSLFLPGMQYLIVIRALRLLRVFRILKLTRFLTEGNILKTAIKASMYKITVFVLSVLTLVTIVGTLMYLVEGEANGYTSIPTSIYWAIVTVTTVGYGDISPQTPAGQFLASILMIIGYGIIAVPTGIVSVEMARASDSARKSCPDCAAPIHQITDNFCSNCGHRLRDKK